MARSILYRMLHGPSADDALYSLELLESCDRIVAPTRTTAAIRDSVMCTSCRAFPGLGDQHEAAPQRSGAGCTP